MMPAYWHLMNALKSHASVPHIGCQAYVSYLTSPTNLLESHINYMTYKRVKQNSRM